MYYRCRGNTCKLFNLFSIHVTGSWDFSNDYHAMPSHKGVGYWFLGICTDLAIESAVEVISPLASNKYHSSSYLIFGGK